MSRKSDDSAGQAAATGKDLKSFRSQIDKLDLQILELVNKRAKLAGQIGKVKAETSDRSFRRPAKKKSSPTSWPATTGRCLRSTRAGHLPRDHERVAGLAEGPQGRLPRAGVQLQPPRRRRRFGQAVEFMPVGSIAAVFEEVNRGHADFGVVPLENSTDGRIADTLDMFIRLPHLKICSEVRLRIHHNLLANCEQHGDPPGLQQAAGPVAVPQLAEQERAARHRSRKWPAPRRRPSWPATSRGRPPSPAGRRPSATACASCSRTSRIRRTTRRASPSSARTTAAAAGNDKTAVMFQVAAQPGSLADVLDVFKQNKINLTWIESFPPVGQGGVRLLRRLRGPRGDPKVRKTLKPCKEHCENVTSSARSRSPPLAVELTRGRRRSTLHDYRSPARLHPRTDRPRPRAHPRAGLQAARQPGRAAHHRRRHRRRGQAAGRPASGHPRRRAGAADPEAVQARQPRVPQANDTVVKRRPASGSAAGTWP